MLDLELRLNKKIEELTIIIEELRSENALLKAKVVTLEAENIKLKDQLSGNSKNTNLPSSKDVFRLKREKKKSGRKPGGQPGHKGSFRAPMVADEIIKVDAPSVCSCGSEMGLMLEVVKHQKVDIPEIKPYVTEYHLHRRYCKKCKKKVSAELPVGVGGDTFGPRLKATIAALSGFYKSSKREVLGILNQMYNLPISLGSISNSEARVSQKCQSSYENLKVEFEKGLVKHIDETGHYNKDKLGWCWLFATSSVAYIKLADSRGMRVLAANIDANTVGTIVTDRYPSYNYFPKDKRQVCWAHIARDFEKFAASSDNDTKMLGIKLTNITKSLFNLEKAMQTGSIKMNEFKEKAKKLRRKMLRYLKMIENISKSIGAVRVARNVIKSDKMLWKFLEDPWNIPLTNNHAERAIRHYVVYRKNSYFTWSDRGDRFIERIISLYLTWKLQKQNPYQNL
jgi:transposase